MLRDYPRVIRTSEQYKEYLRTVELLMETMPLPGTADFERLELLTVLLESYENSKFPIESPDAIDAIVFRMNEKGLKQADLIPYFGTRSRVSEVLSRKRALTVQMIRSISIGLGISTDTLVGLTAAQSAETPDGLDWKKFPFKEMIKRGWLKSGMEPAEIQGSVEKYIQMAGLNLNSASFKRTITGDANSPTTQYVLFAWLARIIQTSRRTRSMLGHFSPDTLNANFLKDVAQLSWSENGPRLAIEFLNQHGISVVIEPSLKGGLLDGAALKDVDGTPIIGLTLRHDRLDNFWFTLLHEIAHLWKHIVANETYVDDFDVTTTDRKESEANRLAREALIPRLVWKRSDAFLTPNRNTILQLAKELRIHPAIIAGRIRKETGNFQQFSDWVGQGEVRKLFAEAYLTEEQRQ